MSTACAWLSPRMTCGITWGPALSQATDGSMGAEVSGDADKAAAARDLVDVLASRWCAVGQRPNASSYLVPALQVTDGVIGLTGIAAAGVLLLVIKVSGGPLAYPPPGEAEQADMRRGAAPVASPLFVVGSR